MTEVSSRSRDPATISGLPSIASRTIVSDPASGARGSFAATDSGSARKANAARDVVEREGEGRDATAVVAGSQLRGRRPERARDHLGHGDLGRVLVEPVLLERPAVESREEQERRVLTGAHVPDVAGPLAVAGEPRCGQGVERHALRCPGVGLPG